MKVRTAIGFLCVLALHLLAPEPARAQRPLRARELGIVPGTLPTGPLNAITDVAGVQVGQTTVRVGDSVRTGVTAILPHAGNTFLDRVPAAIHVGNGFGKLLGVTQVAELGELETPILLTCTLCVWKAADAMAAWMLARPGMEDVRSINPVVGETNDGYVLNAIRSRPVTERDVRSALESAASGPVAEGSVGAGTGTVAFGWKGGIGTSSRRVTAADSSWTVGVLVQSNFGGDLLVLGVPVGRALGREGVHRAAAAQGAKGSIMMIVATDAPLSDRNLGRLAARALVGLARTGSVMGNGSGDYVIAFSTHPGVRRKYGAARLASQRGRQRRDDPLVPGCGRGDRRGDLQLALHRHDRGREGRHGRGDSGAGGGADPGPARRADSDDGISRRLARRPIQQREQIPLELEPQLGLDVRDRRGAETEGGSAHGDILRDLERRPNRDECRHSLYVTQEEMGSPIGQAPPASRSQHWHLPVASRSRTHSATLAGGNGLGRRGSRGTRSCSLSP